MVNIVGQFREIFVLLQKVGNIELYQLITQLQSDLMAMQEENSQLRERLRITEEKKLIERSLVFRDRVYWRQNESGKIIKEPYCQKCWDAAQKLCHLEHVQQGRELKCRVCDSSYGAVS